MRKFFAILITIGLIGCVVVAASNLEPFKSAPPSAMLRIHKYRPRILAADSEKPEDYETYVRTQMQMIKSPFVIGRAVKNDKIHQLPTIEEHNEDAVSWVQQNLSVERLGESEIVKVSLRDCPRTEAAEIINAVVASYMSEVIDAERQDQLRQRDRLQKSYAKNALSIQAKKNELYNLTEEIKPLSDVKKELIARQLKALFARDEKFQDRIFETQLKIELLKLRKTETEKRDQEIGELEAELKVYQQKQTETETSINEKASQLASQAKNNSDRDRLEQELASLEQFNKEIDMKLKELNIELDADSRVRVIDPARP